MTIQASIGQFEQFVLTAILSLGENAYGVTIRKVVGDLAAPKSVSLGAVYATLDRLEDKRFVRSWLSNPTPERGGRSKRHYRLEAPGERALRESVEASRRVCNAVEDILGAIGAPGRRLKPAR
ncbi:MAG TPA: PadR family transcriptional regulator [Vicinamibacterales bacterium]|nr:PadR family transcriptional regulator [Vicinamibacterales bacterium]